MNTYSIEKRLLNSIKESGLNNVLLNGNYENVDYVLKLENITYYGIMIIDGNQYFSFISY
jgi:hypothetical protein